MSDDMASCPAKEPAGTGRRVQAASHETAMQRLPTLQRNALRKVFNRAEFSPAEVAELGYRRLQQAEGIGNKGLTAIAAWLADYGYELAPPEGSTPQRQQSRTQRNIEMAVRLLRTHGFVVQGGEGGGQESALASKPG